jgi:hypothetical protein
MTLFFLARGIEYASDIATSESSQWIKKYTMLVEPRKSIHNIGPLTYQIMDHTIYASGLLIHIQRVIIDDIRTGLNLHIYAAIATLLIQK